MSYQTAFRLILPVLIIPVTTCTCFGFAEIARGSLLLQTIGSVTYDSYFLGTEDNDADIIYTVYPSLRYNRNAGRGTINASAGMAFNRYDVHKDFDSDDIRAAFSAELPTVDGARFDGSFGVNYDEATVVDLYVNDRVATQTFSAYIGLNYRLTDRMTLNESLSYSNSIREIYSDQESLTNQLSFNYKGFLRGTSLVFTHALTLTNTSGDAFTGVGLDQQSNTFSLGLSRPLYGDVNGTLSYGYSHLSRSSDETFSGETGSGSGYLSLSIDGPFLPRNRFPKLASSASLSYSQSATAGLNDDGGKFLAGNVSLTWFARERTKLHVRASRSMDLSITNLTTENTRVGGGFDQQIGDSTNVTGSAGYTWSTSRGVDREDTILDAALGISRSFNKYLSANLNYTYEKNDTAASGFQPGRFAPRDYERHTVMAAITVTF